MALLISQKHFTLVNWHPWRQSGLMGSHQVLHSHPGRTKLLLTPACLCFMVLPKEARRKDSWGMDRWDGTDVKAKCCERRVGEHPQVSLFICPSLDATVLLEIWLVALSWPCNTVTAPEQYLFLLGSTLSLEGSSGASIGYSSVEHRWIECPLG